MTPDWILIANATRARLLERGRGCPLMVIDSFEHPRGRIASSPFPGELKAQLGPATNARLRASHDVDLTSVGVVEVDHRIARETSPR